MPTVVLRLNTKLLTEDHQVFVVRAGKDYRLFPEFSDHSVVMLELPSLGLESGRELSSYGDLSQRVIRSRRIRNWHRRGRPEDDLPPRDLAEYAVRTLDRSEAQLQGFVRGLFERAQKGDLVIVPPKSFMSEALVGEFADEPSAVEEIAVDRLYPGDLLPARRVNWLARLPKRELPGDLIEAVQKPSVLFLLARSLKYDIYQETYANFAIGGDSFTSRFDVTNVDFKSRDDFLIQSFFNFVATNVRAFDEDKPQEVEGLRTAAFRDAGAYDPDLRTNINSPGWLSLFSRHPTPLIAAALLAIAINVEPAVAVEAALNDTITFGDAADPSNPCAVPVHRHVVNHIRLLGLDRWAAACEDAKKAAQRSGLKSPVSADVVP